MSQTNEHAPSSRRLSGRHVRNCLLLLLGMICCSGALEFLGAALETEILWKGLATGCGIPLLCAMFGAILSKDEEREPQEAAGDIWERLRRGFHAVFSGIVRDDKRFLVICFALVVLLTSGMAGAHVCGHILRALQFIFTAIAGQVPMST